MIPSPNEVWSGQKPKPLQHEKTPDKLLNPKPETLYILKPETLMLGKIAFIKASQGETVGLVDWEGQRRRVADLGLARRPGGSLGCMRFRV